jgi:hypothetical protein
MKVDQCREQLAQNELSCINNKIHFENGIRRTVSLLVIVVMLDSTYAVLWQMHVVAIFVFQCNGFEARRSPSAIECVGRS